ncbi:MAG: hypothetical protein WBA61_01255 [Aequorivita sp.]
MINKKLQPFTFIIRASGEATVGDLKSQLKKQISRNDVLITLDDEVSFEEKLRQGYDLAIKIGNEVSVFIDGDILMRSNAVKRIRKIAQRLEESDFGFGLKLWDRFYDRPKFRGLHIYNTKLLNDALKFIPKQGEQLRPESFVKDQMKESGKRWRNDFSFYVAGLHDFYQKPQDIYYKFLVRSKRSIDDIQELKSAFKSMPTNSDYKMALKGLEDGEQMEEVLNDKYLYSSQKLMLEHSLPIKSRNSRFVDVLIMKRLIQYYKINSLFWKSI